MKIDWKRKLSSRKFWAAVSGVVISVMVAFNADSGSQEKGAGVISATGTLAIYMLAEGSTDKAGAVAPSPMERHKFACKIFDILEELIPDSEELLDRTYLEEILGGSETHSPFRCSAKPFVSEGKEMSVTRRLFTDIDGKLIDGKDISEQYRVFIFDAESELKIAVAEAGEDGEAVFISGGELGAAAMYSGIHIIENHPKPNKNMSKAWCKGIGISPSTYYNRLRAVREEMISQQPKLHEIVPVCVSTELTENRAVLPEKSSFSDKPKSTEKITICKNGIEIEIPCDADEHIITLMLRGLKEC